MVTLREEIDEVVVAYLAQHSGEAAPDPHEDLFASGRVNSLFAVQLLGFLERRFDIKVTVDDLDLANFSSVAKIGAFVTEKQSAARLG